MNALLNGLTVVVEQDSTGLVMFGCKLTILLACAWAAHFALRNTNPRWRVLLWRTSCLGVVLLALTAWSPGAVNLAILPGGPSPVAGELAELSPTIAATTPGHSPTETSTPATTSAVRATPPAIVSDLATTPNQPTPFPAHSVAHEPSPDRQLHPITQQASQITKKEAAATVPVTASVPVVTSTPNIEPVVKRPQWSLLRWIATIWLCGAGMAALRLLVGFRQIARVCRAAAPVPEWVHSAAVGIAESLKLDRRFEIRQTDEVQSPCIVGIFRPLILLPNRQCQPEHQDELPAILAHELAHLQGLDVLWNTAFSCLSIGLWFHPFLWRVRLAHADACDAVSDTTAARYLGDAQQYGRTLARLALRNAERELTIGLAMARGSSLKHRLETVQRNMSRATISRLLAGCFVIPCLAIVLLCGLLTLTRAEAAPKVAPLAAAEKQPVAEKAEKKPQPAAAQPTKSVMAVKVVADELGAPLKGVRVVFHGRIDNAAVNRNLETDEEGMVFFERPSSAKVTHLWMQASSPGLVSQHYSWNATEVAFELPAVLELKLKSGTQVLGFVVDEEGNPIAGAQMDIHMPITWPRTEHHVFSAAQVKTDAKGMWKWDGAPEDLSSAHASVNHPDFMRTGGGILNSSSRLVMKRGLQVTGHVADGKGQPVGGAIARIGFDRFGSDDPEARTDEEGRFTLKRCPEGKSIVTVQAEGFSPKYLPVVVDGKSKPLEFKLDPGNTLRVRVVNSQGQPIPKAYFFTDTWAGYRTLEYRLRADANGEIVWKSAPADTVLCDFMFDGYMTQRRIPLKASEKLQTVTLPPPLVISGTVTDAKTGQPIPKFQIRQGQIHSQITQVYWDRYPATEFNNGQYRLQFTEPLDFRLLQIVANNYTSATSRRFASNEGAQTLNFALEPSGKGPSGVVLLPDGKPARGAEVALATSDRRAEVRNGRFNHQLSRADIVKADDEGKFSFSAPESKDFLLVALHDNGFADVLSRDFSSGNKIKLNAWGQLKGRVMLGTKPDANCGITYWPDQNSSGRAATILRQHDFSGRTDAAGNFLLERVVPGPGVVTRIVVTKYPRGEQQSSSWQTPVTVTSGKTTSVSLGGKGRPVKGQLVFDRKPGFEIDWTTNDPISITTVAASDSKTTYAYTRFVGTILKSGEFTVPDVPPGKHRLTVQVNRPPSPNSNTSPIRVGAASHEFTMPEVPGGYSDEPLDVGKVTAVLDDTLDPGEVAPEFVAELVSGGTLRLADYRGKLILLDFWSKWAQESIAEIPALRKVHERFGKDSRFIQIGLACNTEMADTKQIVNSRSLVWPQAIIGSTYGRIAKQYTVTTVPCNFLIGPDGRVLAKDISGDQLERTIEAALANQKLFDAPPAPRGPRFPVTRFPNAADSPKPAEPPAVAVLEDTDPSFDTKQPREDRLRVLSASGKELWSATGFNTCQSVSPSHSVVIDRLRNRLYVPEIVGQRVTAFTLSGKKLWQVEQVSVHTMAIDEKTGNLWCTGGGETVIFDPEGAEVASLPYTGVDMVYDSHADAIWLVGYHIIKLNRQGQILFRKKIDGWCCGAVSVNPDDGSVWITERNHPDRSGSPNRIWLLNSDGSPRREIDFGDKNVWAIAWNRASKKTWFSSHPTGLRHVSEKGEPSQSLPVTARSISISPATGDLWITNQDEVQRIDESGKVLVRSPSDKKSMQSYLIAF